MLDICKEVVIFLFLAKLLEGFQNGGKYGRFVKLVISMIVVLKIITPVFTFFNSDFSWENFSHMPETFFDAEIISGTEGILGTEKISDTKDSLDAKAEGEGTISINRHVEPVKDINILEIEVKSEEEQWER